MYHPKKKHGTKELNMFFTVYIVFGNFMEIYGFSENVFITFMAITNMTLLMALADELKFVMAWF